MEHKSTNKEALTFSAATVISLKTDKIDFTQNSLIVVTSAGIITGTYISEDVENSLNDDITYTVIKSIEENARKLYERPLGTILLKDASMTTKAGTHYSFKYLHVFIEDIIALSIGDMSQN